MMMTTYSELIERQANYMPVPLAIRLQAPAAYAWWQIVTVKTWRGFGMRNLTLRFRARVVLKIAVKAWPCASR